MKSMILAAVAALGLGVGAAYAQVYCWLPRAALWPAILGQGLIRLTPHPWCSRHCS